MATKSVAQHTNHSNYHGQFILVGSCVAICYLWLEPQALKKQEHDLTQPQDPEMKV